MTSSHIWLQKNKQASSCFSNLWLCSRSLYESFATNLLTRKQYFSFWEPVAIYFFYYIIHVTYSHISLQNTNHASFCFSKLWQYSRSTYESLALYLLTRKHYFTFSEPVAIYFLYYIIHVTYSHISLQNTNQASFCFSNLWWSSRSPYESFVSSNKETQL